MKSLGGISLLLLSVGLCVFGLANTGVGLILLTGGGFFWGDFVPLLKGLSFFGFGLFAGHFALRLIRSERPRPPAVTVEETIASAATAPRREEEGEPSFEDIDQPPPGRAWSVLSIMLALGGYFCWWLEVVVHYDSLNTQDMAMYFGLAGLVCAAIAIAQAKRVSMLSGLALLLNAGPWAVLTLLALMFT